MVSGWSESGAGHQQQQRSGELEAPVERLTGAREELASLLLLKALRKAQNTLLCSERFAVAESES